MDGCDCLIRHGRGELCDVGVNLTALHCGGLASQLRWILESLSGEMAFCFGERSSGPKPTREDDF